MSLGGRGEHLAAVRVCAPNPGPFTLEGTNSWLIGQYDLAVIDPGPNVPSHIRALVALCRQAARVSVVVTHPHADHSGAAEPLIAALGAQTSPPEVRLVQPRHETRIETDFGELISVATPGHARDHVVVHWPSAESLFSGDLILGRGDTTWVGEYPGSVADYLASLERVRALSVRTIYPGHGPIIDDPDDALTRFASHRRARIEQVRRLRERHPQADPAKLFDEVYAGRVPVRYEQAALKSLEALLHHIDTHG